jgi:hypothetical protein
VARYIGLVTDESAARREPDQPPRQQRRGRKIAMGQPQLDAFLAGQRTSWDFRMLFPARKTTS